MLLIIIGGRISSINPRARTINTRNSNIRNRFRRRLAAGFPGVRCTVLDFPSPFFFFHPFLRPRGVFFISGNIECTGPHAKRFRRTFIATE